MVARLNADFAVSYQESVPLFWEIDKCHFFDAATQLRITAEPVHSKEIDEINNG
jgi:hypothetical protein